MIDNDSGISGDTQMKNIVKSAVVVGQIINLLVGSKFISPVSYVIALHPYI